MYALIRKWEQSGLPQAKFFSEHKISKSTFGYWRKKYLREQVQIKTQGKMVPIHILAPDAGLVAIYETINGKDSPIYFIHKDYLGSIQCISNEQGQVLETLSFDPWGNRRNPNDWNIDNPPQEPPLFDRGFTGHQHLDDFHLINMNGRVYDPILAQFLIPDNYIQAPDYSQSLNRYTYCLNNPLKYTDPDGEIWHLVIGAAIGGVMNWAMNGAEFSWRGLGYFGVGAAAGALGAGVGSGMMAASAGSSFGAGFIGSQGAMAAISSSYTSSFLSGAAVGSASGFTSGFVAGTGNSWLSGNNFGQGLTGGLVAGVWGALGSAVIGGISSGFHARMDKRHFITGKPPYVDESLSVPYVGQNPNSTDCLIANAEMLEKYYGGNRTMTDFKKILNSLPPGADMPRDFYEAAGFKIMGVPENAKHIISTMKHNKYPTTITTLEGTDINGNPLFHESTITRVRMWTPKAKATFWVNDPARGANYRWSQKALYEQIWNRFVIGGN